MAAILRNSGGLVTTSSVVKDKYIRNDEYLDLPNLVNGDEKIYILAMIYEQSNYFEFYATGDYQIDWGDGQGVQSYSSGTYAEYSVDWNNISSSTTTSLGLKQIIITVEPQVGSSLTFFRIYGGSNSYEPLNYNHHIRDIKMAGQNFTSFASSFNSIGGLEQFEFIGTAPSATSVHSMFKSSGVRKIISLDTSNVTQFFDFFSACSLLVEIPKFNLSSATNVLNMFENNYRLTYIDPWDLDVDAPNLTSISLMFDGVPVKNVPITSCSNITNFTNCFLNTKFKTFNLPCPSAIYTGGMFSGCVDLETISTVFPNTITSAYSMFSSCSKLKDLTPFDTSNITAASFMFYGTSSLKDISWVDFSSVTDIREMFRGSRIEKLPNIFNKVDVVSTAEIFFSSSFVINPNSLDGVKANSLYRFAKSSGSLERVPLLDVTSVTDIRQAFSGCVRIPSLPSWDLSGVTTSDTTSFSSCTSLRESNITGLTRTHSYASCKLDRSAIVNIFNNLGTSSGTQTIYVTGNPGSSDLTSSDLLIATNKGWIVVS